MPPPSKQAQPARQLVFTEFCRRIGFLLTPAQLVLCKVAYDGVDPVDLPPEEQELAITLFGPVERVPPICRAIIVHVAGARAGKSSVLLGLRVLHLALTCPIGQLASGERASAMIIARDLKLARQTLSFVRGAADAFPAIAQRIVNPGKDSFGLQRQNGQVVTVEILPATAGGAAGRGRSLVCAALEEFAFFHSADSGGYVVNDKEVFQAVHPRVLRGGQVLIGSTPWASSGMLFELHRDNWGHPATCLVSYAPTLLLNPSKDEEVQRERELDPENAKREFDAVFLDSTANRYFSGNAIEASVDPSLHLPLKPPRGAEVMIGADVGFRRDSSALVVVYRLHDRSFVVAEILELSPKAGKPLVPSEVLSRFAEVCKRHGCPWLMADGVYRETVVEELAKHQLSYVPAPAGANAKATSYVIARNLLHAGRLKLPRHARLIQQFKDVVAVPLAGGGMSFHSPRRQGAGHGDILSALILAVSQKGGEATEPLDTPPLSAQELAEQQTRAYWERTRRQIEQSKEDAGGFSAYDTQTNEEGSYFPW